MDICEGSPEALELRADAVRLRLLRDEDERALVAAARHSPSASAPAGEAAVVHHIRRAQNRRAHGVAVTLTVEWECLAPKPGAFGRLETTRLIVGTVTIEPAAGEVGVWLAGSALANGVMEATLELVRTNMAAIISTVDPDPAAADRTEVLPTAAGE